MTKLAAALRADSAAVRWQTIENLNKAGRLKSSDGTTLSMLVEALADEHPFVRWQAGRVLAEERAGWQKLIELLRADSVTSDIGGKTSRMRSAAIDALAASQSPEVDAVLIDMLRSGEALLRQSAAEALAQRGCREAVSPLIGALKDGSPLVRRAAAYALGHIGDPSAAGILIERLQDEAVIVRRSAAYALGALRAEVAVAPLRTSLTDADTQVRRNAAWALGRIGQTDAVPDLARLLADPALEGTIASTAKEAIDTITKPGWLRALSGWRSRAH